jgi:enoyl-CoA hydratase/carnithine racemase
MSEVEVDRDQELDGLVTITLNRPEKLNALNVALHDAIQPVLVELETDPTARVVVLTGAGRAFSAGADLNDRRDGKPVNDIERLQRAHLGGRTTELIDRLPQVVIAQINGLAVGGAVVFLTACDIRLAAESAWMSIPEVELGMPLTWQAIPRLMRELGPARTKEVVMACDRFTAQQAYEWGFVNHVYPDAELANETRKLAAKLLSMDPLSLSLTKSACAAAANTMVTVDTNWADAELMLHTYRRLGDRKLR